MNRQTEAVEANAAAGPADSMRLPANVKLLGVTSLVNDIASEAVYPLLPDLLRSIMATGYAEIGLALGVIEGIAEAISSILKLFAGGWSDRTGRRKGWIVAGYSLSAAAKPLLALVAHPWQMLACRVGDRFGKGLRTRARDAVIAESTSPAARGWAFGFHRGMDHIGAAIGPMLAFAYLELWPDRLQTLFLLTIVPGVAVVAILIFGLREPRHSVAAAQPFVLSLKPLSGNFRLYLVSLVVFTLGNSSDLFLLALGGVGRAGGAIACDVVCLSRGQKRRQHARGAHGRAHRGTAADRGRMAGLRRGLSWICPGQRGLARLGLVPVVRRVLRLDRAA